jgi:hypothetical protein
VTFFFDHNLPPDLARALDCLDIDATYLTNEFSADAADEAWMPEVAKRGYIVITRDRNIQKRPAQRELYRQLRLRGLFLGPAFSKMRLRELARWLLWRWDDIEDTMSSAKPGEAYLLHQRGRLEKL